MQVKVEQKTEKYDNMKYVHVSNTQRRKNLDYNEKYSVFHFSYIPS